MIKLVFESNQHIIQKIHFTIDLCPEPERNNAIDEGSLRTNIGRI